MVFLSETQLIFPFKIYLIQSTIAKIIWIRNVIIKNSSFRNKFTIKQTLFLNKNSSCILYLSNNQIINRWNASLRRYRNLSRCINLQFKLASARCLVLPDGYEWFQKKTHTMTAESVSQVDEESGNAGKMLSYEAYHTEIEPAIKQDRQ